MSDWTMEFPTGRKLEGSGRPENWLGTVGSHDEATPDRVELARRHFVEASAGDFERRGNRGRIWVDRATGNEYTEVSGCRARVRATRRLARRDVHRARRTDRLSASPWRRGRRLDDRDR